VSVLIRDAVPFLIQNCSNLSRTFTEFSCPWTGTAIGKKNMGSFQMFVGLVFICLIMDIFLLTAGAMM
jgi:hypothetical protein